MSSFKESNTNNRYFSEYQPNSYNIDSNKVPKIISHYEKYKNTLSPKNQ